MKTKKTIIQFNKANVLSLISTLSAILGIILSLNNMLNFPIMLLMVSFICNAFDGYYKSDDNLTKLSNHYHLEFNSFSSLLSFTIFPAVILFKSVNLWYKDLIIPLYIISSVIRLSYFNANIISNKESNNYYNGMPITVSAIILPLIYMVNFINKDTYSYLAIIFFIILSILQILNIKIKKPNIKTIINYFGTTRYNKVVRIIINFVLFPMFLALASDLFFKVNAFDGFALFDALKTPFNYPLPFIMITLLFSLITLIFTGIFKNTNHSKPIIILVLMIFLVVNDCKYIIMSRPVVLSDVNFLNASNMEMSALFMNTIKGIWVLKVLVKAIILFVISVILFKSKLSKIEFKRNLSRLEVTLGSLFIFILFIFFTVKNSFYMVTKTYNVPLEEIYKIEDYAEVYYKQGLFQGILFNTYSSSIFKPSNYDKDDVKKLLKSTDIEKEDWGKPDIVIILSESFFDVSNINEIKFDKDLMPNIHKFEKDNDKVVTNTYVSTFGGSSVVSEWEILTGATNQFNVATYIPYTDYYLKKNKKNVDKSPHIIKSLNEEGYITKYITPWAGESYNSKKTYKMVGADKTVYDLKGEKKGLWLSDKAITDSIISELNKDTDKPKLLIYATSQNHMPCEDDRYDKYDIDVLSSSFSEEDTSLIKCYAQGVFDADKELGSLYEQINKLDKDTIVIFYGDHLPYINNKSGSNSIKASSYLNNNDKSLENLHNFTTKGVVISNYITKMDKSINYINLNYLSSYVYSHLDIKDKEYYNFINNTRKSIPVFSRRYIYNPVNKEFTSLNNLNKKDKKILEDFRNVQYYEFFDK